MSVRKQHLSQNEVAIVGYVTVPLILTPGLNWYPSMSSLL